MKWKFSCFSSAVNPPTIPSKGAGAGAGAAGEKERTTRLSSAGPSEPTSPGLSPGSAGDLNWTLHHIPFAGTSKCAASEMRWGVDT